MNIVIRNLFRLSLAAVLLAGASLANADQVVVVHPGNPMTTISAKDLGRIYLGKARSFPDGGRVNPVNQESGSEARNSFYQEYTGMSDARVKSHWSKLMFSGKGNPPTEVAGDAAMKREVASDPSAIGYIDESSVDDSVKPVTVTR